MKKTISWLVALVMLICIMPGVVMAADSENLIFELDLSEYTVENKTVKNAVEGENLSVVLNGTPSSGTINGNPYINFSTGDSGITVSETEGKENTVFKNQSMTFEIWAKTDNFKRGAGMKRFFVLTEDVEGSAGYCMVDVPVYDGELWYRPYWVKQTATTTRSYTYKYDMKSYNEEWNHIVLVRNYDANTDTCSVATYVNGNLISASAETAEEGSRNHPDPLSLIIGNSGNYAAGFEGSIAEFKVYNSALTENSVKEKYNASSVNYIDEKLVFDLDLSDYTDENKTVKNAVEGADLSVALNGTPLSGTINGNPYINFSTGNSGITVSETEGKEKSVFKNQSMTFEIWAKSDNFKSGAGMKRFFVLTENVKGSDGYCLVDVPVYDGELWYRPYWVKNLDATRSYTYRYNMKSYNEKWNHIVMVREYNGGSDTCVATLYVNGEKVSATTTEAAAGSRNHPDPLSLIIGNCGNYAAGFEGDIADFNVYNMALTESSVKNKYAKSKDNYVDEKLIFDLDLSDYNEDSKLIKNSATDNFNIAVNGTPIKGMVNNTPYITFGANGTADTAVTLSEKTAKSVLKNQSMTFELWAKTDQFVKNATMTRLFALTEDATSNSGSYNLVEAPVYNGQLWFRPYWIKNQEGSEKSFTYKYNMTNNNEMWNHIVLVREYDAATDTCSATVYVNGNKVGETEKVADTSYLNYSSNAMSLILGNMGGYGNSFNGDIAEFKVYNSAISEEAVKTKYGMSAIKFTQLTPISYTDASSQVITSLNGVTVINAKTLLKNWDSSSAPTVVFAAYKENGALEKVVFATVTKTSEGYDIDATLTGLNLTENSNVKLFVWQSVPTLRPIVEVAKFNGGGV